MYIEFVNEAGTDITSRHWQFVPRPGDELLLTLGADVDGQYVVTRVVVRDAFGTERNDMEPEAVVTLAAVPE